MSVDINKFRTGIIEYSGDVDVHMAEELYEITLKDLGVTVGGNLYDYSWGYVSVDGVFIAGVYKTKVYDAVMKIIRTHPQAAREYSNYYTTYRDKVNNAVSSVNALIDEKQVKPKVWTYFICREGEQYSTTGYCGELQVNKVVGKYDHIMEVTNTCSVMLREKGLEVMIVNVTDKGAL